MGATLTIPEIFELHFKRSGGDIMAAVHAVLEAGLASRRPKVAPLQGDEWIEGEAKRIAIAVGEVIEIPFALMRSARKSPRVCRGRGIAMLFVRERTRMSYPLIGMIFAKDHSTVFTACNHARRLMVEKPDLRARIQDAIGGEADTAGATLIQERSAA